MAFLQDPTVWMPPLFWAGVIAMLIGIGWTASQLDRAEWKKWTQWRLLEPKTAIWPFWAVITAICLLAILSGDDNPLWYGSAWLSLASSWTVLERSVRRHIHRERRRRKQEMTHWQTRLKAEQWIAQQSLLKRRELARVQSDSLRHLMDPHFLFNALSGVMHDFLNGDRTAGLSHLRAFRRLAIDQMDAGRGGWLTLDREWSMLGDYIQLELRRINRPVEWTLHPVPDTLSEWEIPAFMVQPLVENALWHGLGGTAVDGDGRLSVKVEQEGTDQVLVTVRNSRHPSAPTLEGDRTGPHASPRRRRHATDLIRHRLQLMDQHSGKKALSMETDAEETRARLTLPCRKQLWTTS